jgi:putative transposase
MVEVSTVYSLARREQMARRSYPTDLSDTEWRLIDPHIPPHRSGGRPAIHPRRELVNAMSYVLRTGCAWRLLPHDFPAWQTVYHYFRIWRDAGVFEQLNHALREQVRQQAGREREPSGAIIDSQTVKTTEKGGSVGMTVPRR